jgi:hypothetical protein
MARYSKAEIAESREALLAHLKPGDTVRCVLRHVSRSGMRRHIDFYAIKDNEPATWYHVAGHIARVLGYSQAKDGSIKVDGCGMDMGFQVVHSLCYALWGHNNHEGHDNTRSGYQLRSEWL